MLHAQDTSLTVGATTKLNQVIPAHQQYQYLNFFDGKVQFKDGKVSVAKMNYNILTDEMHFITAGGDTLALDNEPTINFVCVAKDTFYFDNGYIMLVNSVGLLKLGVKQRFRIVDKKKQAGYDQMSSSSSVSNLSSYDDSRSLRQLNVEEQLTIIKVSQFYFSDKFNHFVLATQKNLAEIFPNCDEQLKKFCKENKIDFARGRGLLELVSNFPRVCPSNW